MIIQLYVIPPDSNYVAPKYIQEAIEGGIGIWYLFKNIGVFEFVYPKFNRNKNKELRAKIIRRIKSKNEEQLELVG